MRREGDGQASGLRWMPIEGEQSRESGGVVEDTQAGRVQEAPTEKEITHTDHSRLILHR